MRHSDCVRSLTRKQIQSLYKARTSRVAMLARARARAPATREIRHGRDIVLKMEMRSIIVEEMATEPAKIETKRERERGTP